MDTCIFIISHFSLVVSIYVFYLLSQNKKKVSFKIAIESARLLSRHLLMGILKIKEGKETEDERNGKKSTERNKLSQKPKKTLLPEAMRKLRNLISMNYSLTSRGLSIDINKMKRLGERICEAAYGNSNETKLRHEKIDKKMKKISLWKSGQNKSGCN